MDEFILKKKYCLIIALKAVVVIDEQLEECERGKVKNYSFEVQPKKKDHSIQVNYRC